MATDQNIKNKTLASEIDTAFRGGFRTAATSRVDPRPLVGTWWIDMQFGTYFRKPLLGNLFVVDGIFFGGLRPEDIQYCHS